MKIVLENIFMCLVTFWKCYFPTKFSHCLNHFLSIQTNIYYHFSIDKHRKQNPTKKNLSNPVKWREEGREREVTGFVMGRSVTGLLMGRLDRWLGYSWVEWIGDWWSRTRTMARMAVPMSFGSRTRSVLGGSVLGGDDLVGGAIDASAFVVLYSCYFSLLSLLSLSLSLRVWARKSFEVKIET